MWHILTFCWSPVDIATDDGYWISSPDKVSFWREGNHTLWRYGVGSLTGNCQLVLTVAEGGWHAIIHWYASVPWGKAWLTCLGLTFQAIAFYLVTAWCYARYTWRVSSSRWGAVSVFGLNSNWVWNSYEVFLRLEGNRASQWVQGVGPDFLAILSSWKASFSDCFTCYYKLSWLICINLDWHVRVSWCEAWSASLTCSL